MQHWIETGEILVAAPRYAQHSNLAIVAMHNALGRNVRKGKKAPKVEGYTACSIETPQALIPSKIDDFFTTRPFRLQSAFDTIADQEDGSALEAVQHLTAALDLSAWLEGEKQTTIKFEAESLSYSVRITESTQRSVYIHNDAEDVRQEFPVTNETDLKAIAHCIMSYKAELESGCGILRPVPRSDSVLLAILDAKRWDEESVPRFAEAQRAVSRSCLLDATIELLTPFGLQPIDFESRMVLVDLLPKKTIDGDHKPVGIVIERLDNYLRHPATQDPFNPSEESDSTYGSQGGIATNIDTAVIIRELKSSHYACITEDRMRQPIQFLREKGFASELAIADLPKGLIYDLSKHDDVVAFVTRILAGRNEIRTDYIVPFAERCARHGWDRKQEIPQTAAGSTNHMRVLACRARKTNLRSGVVAEALLEKDTREEEAARKRQTWADMVEEDLEKDKMEEEVARKAAELEREMQKLEEMRRNWKLRADAELHRLVRRNREGVLQDETVADPDMVEDL